MKSISILKLALFVLIASILIGCNTKLPSSEVPSPVSLPVAAVTTATDTLFRDYPASIQGAANVEIRPQVSGTLEKVYVDEGSYVSKGQPLFRINDKPYLAQLNSATANLHGARAAMENAQIEVDKLTPLVENKVVSPFQMKIAKAAFEVAKANVEQARASIAAANVNEGYSLIKAPVSGFIGLLQKKQGSLVGPSDPTPLTIQSDIHTVHVYFSMSEDDFLTFKAQYRGESLADKLKGMPPVSLVLSDKSIYRTKGKLDLVDGQFDKNTGSITFRASFLNPKGLLRSGNTGKVRLGAIQTDAIVVPQSATLDLQDKVVVFVVSESNKVKKQPITVMGKSGGSYLIRDGVKAGDEIVLSGMDRLQEGQVIRPEKLVSKTSRN